MEGECKVQLDSTVATEAGRQTRQAVKLGSKLSAALLLLLTLGLAAAAAAAAVLVSDTLTKQPGPGQDGFDLHHALRHISNVRAAIHLEGKHNSERNDSVEWKNQVDQSHSQGELRLSDNEIIIPHNGLYFVYSQASFRVSCSFSVDDSYYDAESRSLVHVSHTVKRWSRSYGNSDSKPSYQTILHSIRTVCQKTESSDPDEQGKWFYAIYMGAVFNLREGDRLKTVMERNLADIADEPGKTFFGVFAL